MTDDAPGDVPSCGACDGLTGGGTRWLPDSRAMRVSHPLALVLARLVPPSRVYVPPALIDEPLSLLHFDESDGAFLAILAIWVMAAVMGVSYPGFQRPPH
jgi:hypothetical protein